MMTSDGRIRKELDAAGTAEGDSLKAVERARVAGGHGSFEYLSTRIAIVISGRKVSPHFGKAEEIMLINVEDGDIRDREILIAPPHECGALPAFLKRKGVERLVTGSIGARALENLEAAGIRVYSGAKGPVEDALGSLLSGNLVSSEAVCEGGLGACAGGSHVGRNSGSQQSDPSG
ncbi:MAG: NifB/NifX family molybdenum-iron cluster-binding protein [Actinobacteria bacterium]|nr:NifB/NifX family molybdenum-iron cluster-binding protein [Actinomycetota bacterium]MBU1943511.1 NifB/NifX family molybdenum-iron cluster-binding protein [Actinomycetota bacterium]MBU2686472.1 NifB/NifX family molybdenum-iron cluster-binding protein [Actinomycetota bacterium]